MERGILGDAHIIGVEGKLNTRHLNFRQHKFVTTIANYNATELNSRL